MIGAEKHAGLHQVHENCTIRVDDSLDRSEQADGMITSTKGLVLCLRTADCQGFVTYEPKNNILGVLHVGWRGLLAKAITEHFRMLKEEFDIDPSDVLIGAGPSLCIRCSDFRGPEHEIYMLGKDYRVQDSCDLQRASKDEFLSAGVKEEHIERMKECTRCDSDTFWSYRGGDREGVKNGHSNVLACVLL